MGKPKSIDSEMTIVWWESEEVFSRNWKKTAGKTISAITGVAE
jgi:hypothetical protein